MAKVPAPSFPFLHPRRSALGAPKKASALALLVASACSVGQSDAESSDTAISVAREHIELPPPMSVTAATSRCASQVVYLNFEGVTLSGTSGPNDARANQTWVAGKPGASATLPPFNSNRCGVGRAAAVAQTVNRVKEVFANWNIQFVTERPSSGSYTMAVVGGVPEMLGEDHTYIGVSPQDVGNQNPNDVVFVFSDSPTFPGTPIWVADALAHELGHSFGMAHIDTAASIMAPMDTGLTTTRFVAGYATNQANYGWEPNSYHDQPAELGSLFGSADAPCVARRGDVNGDGRADLVTVAGGQVLTYGGTAAGQFADPGVTEGGIDSALSDGTGALFSDLADVNGDGRADLVSLGLDRSVYVSPGNRDGTFAARVPSFAGTFVPAFRGAKGHEFVGVADVSGDGRADLVTFFQGTNEIYVYQGTADAKFGDGVSSGHIVDSAYRTGTGHWLVDVADVNGDGFADLVTVHSAKNAVVFLGGPGGRFEGVGISSFAGTMDAAELSGAGHEIVGAADVTGDGRADLVTYYTREKSVYVYPGKSDGTFGEGVSSFSGTMVSNLFGASTGHELIASLDINGDGRADLVTLFSSGDVYVYPGQTDGRFGDPATSFAGTMRSVRSNKLGHEFVSERKFVRRLGCPATGCAQAGN